MATGKEKLKNVVPLRPSAALRPALEPEVSDAVLVAKTLSGDRDSYRVLVERYEKRVFSIAYNVLRNDADAQDVAQESFVKAFISLKNFQGASSFYTWLYRIVMNMAIDLKRKRRRQGGDHEELQPDLTPDQLEGAVSTFGDGTPEQALDRKERAQLVNRALGDLSDEHRMAIVLREVDGLSYEEIAEVTGATRGTVMSRLFYARKKIQGALARLAQVVTPREGSLVE